MSCPPVRSPSPFLPFRLSLPSSAKCPLWVLRGCPSRAPHSPVGLLAHNGAMAVCYGCFSVGSVTPGGKRGVIGRLSVLPSWPLLSGLPSHCDASSLRGYALAPPQCFTMEQPSRLKLWTLSPRKPLLPAVQVSSAGSQESENDWGSVGFTSLQPWSGLFLSAPVFFRAGKSSPLRLYHSPPAPCRLPVHQPPPRGHLPTPKPALLTVPSHSTYSCLHYISLKWDKRWDCLKK